MTETQLRDVSEPSNREKQTCAADSSVRKDAIGCPKGRQRSLNDVYIQFAVFRFVCYCNGETINVLNTLNSLFSDSVIYFAIKIGQFTELLHINAQKSIMST